MTLIDGTMPLLTIHHKTEYRHVKPVALGGLLPACVPGAVSISEDGEASPP
jgi:hypothetical protein